MNKSIKWTLIIGGGFALLLFIAYRIMIAQTKSHSPEETIIQDHGEATLSVTYSRPYKKGRVIFGELEPYGEVWRTGANEATTFKTSHNLLIADEPLPAGKYTLWTIPGEERWKVIFNKENYDWGVNRNGVAARDPTADALMVEVASESTTGLVEQFTIRFEDEPFAMILEWDATKVVVPIQVQE
uniref:DUF2911 domain-containing protein n=1 Tax=Roseihalotalea indica TaxID=2867963 RepID=A0AA49GSA2_9BACT|nr:DUF2911 domain-containing protein [Tunicatimonas sp. TK19036]